MNKIQISLIIGIIWFSLTMIGCATTTRVMTNEDAVEAMILTARLEERQLAEERILADDLARLERLENAVADINERSSNITDLIERVLFNFEEYEKLVNEIIEDFQRRLNNENEK